MTTFVIAEAGSCHSGSLATAKHLIRAAAEAGANACKFQFWSDADRLADRRHVPDEYREVYRRFALPVAWLPELAATCGALFIEFMATAYLPEDLPTLAPFIKRWKIASFEASDREFIAAHAPYGKPLIISTGMMTGRPPCVAGVSVAWLHCVSAYPAPIDSLNLAVLRSGLYDGFSDHSAPNLTWTGALSVAALGCEDAIIEAHLRLDDTDPANPDYPHAMTPRQFGDYVRAIRFAEKCLGSGEKRCQPCEENMRQYRVGGGVTHA